MVRERRIAGSARRARRFAFAGVLALAAPAFAGDVSVVVDRKGVVRVTGSAGADQIEIAAGAASGSVAVRPGAGTTLNGAGDALEFPAAKGVRVALGDGDDVLTVPDTPGGTSIGGPLRIDMGAGAATVDLRDVTIAGGLDVRLPRGGGTVALRDATLPSGDVRVRATDASSPVTLTVERTLLTTGSIVAEGALAQANVVRLRDADVRAGGVTWRGGEVDDDVEMKFVTAGGRLTVLPGARGVHRTSIADGDFALPGRIAGGTGADTVTIDRSLFVGKGFVIDTGRGGADSVTVRTCESAGAFRIAGSKSGATSVTLQTLAVAAGGVDVRLGKGGGSVTTFGTDMRGAFSVASPGPLALRMRSDLAQGLTVLSTGTGAQDSVGLETVTIAGPTRIDLGSGTVETLTVLGGTFDGAVTLTLAAAAATVGITGVQVPAPGAVTLRTGGGPDEVTVGGSTFGGAFTASTGAGDDRVAADGTTFSGAFRLDGGPGTDRFCDGFAAPTTYGASRTVVNVEEDRRASRGDDATGCTDGTRRASVPRISLTQAGGDADGPSRLAFGTEERANRVLEEDGEAVVFMSEATNLVAGDTNGGSDIFAASIVNEILVERVSVRSGGGQFTHDGRSGPPVSRNPSMSAQARFVAFESTAADAVDGDGNFESDVFLRDRLDGTTHAMSDPFPHDDGNGGTFHFPRAWGPSISGEGRDVAFVSNADYLDTEPDTITFLDPQVWVAYFSFDGTVFRRRASVRTDGQPAPPAFGYSGHPSLSFRADECAFHSTIQLTDDAPGPATYKVYVRKFTSPAATELITVTNGGRTFEGTEPTISDDGTLVAFLTREPLDPADTNGTTDVYVKNRTTGAFTWASPPPAGGFAVVGPAPSHAFLAGGGRFVAFSAAGKSIRPNEAEFFHRDVYLFDMTTRITVETGTGARGEARGDTRTPSLTPNGRWLAFASVGSDFESGRADGNGTYDVWVQDRGAGAVAPPAKR